jgi:hypothetical protein
VIHYHGTPITPDAVAMKVLRARHALVSHRHARQIALVAAICQSFCLDNGAFSAWNAGAPIVDWSAFYAWCALWLHHPGCDFALIPDVIDGTVHDNDRLIAEWPHGHKGVPVWHMHEPLDRLDQLSRQWPRIALGSSGDFASVGSASWWIRISEAVQTLEEPGGYPRCKLHGLRMLNPRVFQRLPLASADSTNIARNIGIDKAWKGTYVPKSKESRALVLADAIESVNSMSTQLVDILEDDND